jgi:hypothetical protein
MTRLIDQLGAEVWALKEWLTPADLELLERAGILEVVARHGNRVEYRVKRGAECLLR